jgi:hypothetical protein
MRRTEAPSFGESEIPEDKDVDFDLFDPDAIAELLNSVPEEDPDLFPPLANSQFGAYRLRLNAPGGSYPAQSYYHPPE